jgi:hypothetical protein
MKPTFTHSQLALFVIYSTKDGMASAFFSLMIQDGATAKGVDALARPDILPLIMLTSDIVTHILRTTS